MIDRLTREWLEGEDAASLREIVIYAADLLFLRRIGVKPAALVSRKLLREGIDPPRRFRSGYGRRARPTEEMDAILNRVAGLYGIAPQTLRLSLDLAHDVTHPRQHFMCEAWEAGYSLPAIGRYLGGMHHTTVLHGRDRHRARIASQGEGLAA